MASGAGFAMDAIKRIRSNRALLKKKAPFQILKENGFIKTSGKKYTFKKMTQVQKGVIRNKVAAIKLAEKKKLIVTSALTILITAVVIVMSIQLTKLIF